MSTQEPVEVRIEREYDARMAHARAMFNMAVQSAESVLDGALANAEMIRSEELSEARRTALSAAQEAS